VSSIIGKWSAGSNRLGADARAWLYSKNGFGSAPPRHKDKEGVAVYFTALPRLKSPTLRASRCLPLLPISTRTNRSAERRELEKRTCESFHAVRRAEKTNLGIEIKIAPSSSRHRGRSASEMGHLRLNWAHSSFQVSPGGDRGENIPDRRLRATRRHSDRLWSALGDECRDA
jgi:hypothetical protein